MVGSHEHPAGSCVEDRGKITPGVPVDEASPSDTRWGPGSGKGWFVISQGDSFLGAETLAVPS